MSDKSSFETILKWTVIIILGIVALNVLVALLDVALGLAIFLISRVLPLVVLVWVVWKLIEWLGGRGRGSTAGSTYDI